MGRDVPPTKVLARNCRAATGSHAIHDRQLLLRHHLAQDGLSASEQEIYWYFGKEEEQEDAAESQPCTNGSAAGPHNESSPVQPVLLVHAAA